MGDFAEAMLNTQASSDAPAPASSEQLPESSPSSVVTGSAPSPPPQTDQQQQPSPRTPTQPAGQQPQQARPGEKQVDLRALHEARALTKDLRETYSWLPKEAVQSMRGFYEAYARDPALALASEYQTLLQHPQLRERAMGYLQQMGFVPAQLANGQSQGQGDDDPEPTPDYRLKDGTPFMSAQRLAEWRAWHDRQNDRRFEEKIAPIQQFVTESQRELAMQQIVSNANQFAERLFSEAKTWPHFTENQKAIGEKFSEYQHQMPALAALQRAYIAVVHDHVLPTLASSAKQEVAQDLHQRVRATTPNPTRATGSRTDRRPESFRDAAERILGSRAS